jgi:hypothetical protein
MDKETTHSFIHSTEKADDGDKNNTLTQTNMKNYLITLLPPALYSTWNSRLTQLNKIINLSVRSSVLGTYVRATHSIKYKD